MKTKRFLAVVSATLCALTLGACTNDPVTPDPVDPDPVDPVDPDPVDEACTLSISLNYDKNTGMTYKQSVDYATPNGTQIKSGDFKPVWKELQNKLNFTINDVTDTTGKAIDYFKNNWKTNQFADIAVGGVSIISQYGTQTGTILDLKEYLDKMPNFKDFLETNPIVKTSISTTSYKDPKKTAIYYAPYFDGFDDIERYTLLRADFVRKLLDSDINSVEWDTDSTIWTTNKYKAQVEDSSYSVTVPESMDSDKTKTVTKKAVTNIVEQQNALAQDQRTSKVMVKQLRDYLSAKYGSQYKTLSDIFLGVDACYDADEMVALMRVVKVSPKALTGIDNAVMVPFTPREYTNDRTSDLYRWAAQLWGVRGLESRSGYLYIDKDKNGETKVFDARGESDTADLLENLNALYSEGLIAELTHEKGGYGNADGKLAEALLIGNGSESSNGKTYCGFMMYDYSQSQGALNDKAESKTVEGYDFRPIINAVSEWEDGEYFQFTESWRSVKTEGWCINASIVNDEVKLNKALKLFDYLYSEEGQALYTCGPQSEGYYTEIVDGVPQLSEKTIEQFHDSNIGGDSYTNYFRKFVGAGLNNGSIKNYGVEMQCTSANALNGVKIVAKALEVGTFRHVQMDFTEDPFYTITPSTFNLSSGQATQVQDIEKGGLNNINSSKNNATAWNIWDNYVIYGFNGKTSTETLKSKDGYIKWINEDLKLDQLVGIYNDAYELMIL
jgi:hypothetical protein